MSKTELLNEALARRDEYRATALKLLEAGQTRTADDVELAALQMHAVVCELRGGV